MSTAAARLHEMIAAICPIIGVSIGRRDDKSTWRLDFDESATEEQQKAAAEIIAGFELEEPPTRVTVTMAQARLALNAAGLLPKVQAAVDAAGGDAQIEWEYSGVVHRDSPLVKTLAAAISLPDEQIDALFADAAKR